MYSLVFFCSCDPRPRGGIAIEFLSGNGSHAGKNISVSLACCCRKDGDPSKSTEIVRMDLHLTCKQQRTSRILMLCWHDMFFHHSESVNVNQSKTEIERFGKTQEDLLGYSSRSCRTILMLIILFKGKAKTFQKFQ